MMTAFNDSSYENKANDNWVPDDNNNDLDPDNFEQIYREYCDQGIWEEHEIQFDTYSQNI
jgi:hypothetical protein